MSTRTYPADEIDKQVDLMSAGAVEVLQEKNAAVARVTALETENAGLREKLARTPAVELEKVATAPFSFAPSALETTMNLLNERGIVVREARGETMQKLASDPGYALDMLRHLANFNVAPLVQPRGGGIDTTSSTVKSASAGADTDWFEEPAGDS